MNIQELKRRLLAFQGFRNDEDDDGSGLGGELITMDPGEAPGADEDRGDTLTVDEPAAPPAPAPAAGKTEAEATDPADEADETGRKGGAIPHARFNEVNEARKEAQRLAELERQRADAAEAELAAYRAGKPAAAAPPAAPVFDEVAKEREYADALMEGDLDKAGKVRSEINRELRRQAAQDAIEQQRANEDARQLATVAKQAETDYPYLSTPEGQDVLDMILLSRDQRARKGIPMHQALADAVAAIAPKFAPADDAPPSRELQTPASKTDTRTTQAIARGAAASAAQPPAVQAGIGNRASAAMVDVESMSDEQFEALSESEKAKLRGDSA